MNLVSPANWCILLLWTCCCGSAAETVHHYVFFNRERERISDSEFIATTALEGAQLKYTWRELEPEKGAYLKVNYIFWCAQEPFYSKRLLPLLKAQR
jgi:hypothetical protein